MLVDVDKLAYSAHTPATDQLAWGWTVRATEPDWINLADWVDWLVTAYDLRPARTVLPCWPAHPGVTEELAALHSAWAVAAAQDAPGDAMVLWHDRSLHPTLSRLREAYQQHACTDTHTAPRTSVTVNTTLLERAATRVERPPAASPSAAR